MKATVSTQTTILADTGDLSGSGGSLEASSLSGVVPGNLVGDTLHASTIGQGDRTRSEASVGAITLTGGLNAISADLVMSRAAAVRHGSSVDVSASSDLDGLFVNGLPIVATGQPNQSVPLLEGQLVLNEQSTSTSGGVTTITVNALHLTAGDIDVVLGTSKAGVSTGSSNCSSNADFATGGGWTQPTLEAKRTFGFVGGVKQNGNLQVHLVFVNHELNERFKAVTLASYLPVGNTRIMTGTGEADGQPTNFDLTIEDNGEPGTGDTFTLDYVAPGGPRSEGGTLGGGNIQIHDVCS